MSDTNGVSPIMQAASELAAAVVAEGLAEMEQTRIGAELTVKFFGTINEQNAGKPHSFDSAERAAKQTPEYIAAKLAVLDARRTTILAAAARVCAEIDAWSRTGTGRGAL